MLAALAGGLDWVRICVEASMAFSTFGCHESGHDLRVKAWVRLLHMSLSPHVQLIPLTHKPVYSCVRYPSHKSSQIGSRKSVLDDLDFIGSFARRNPAV